ncbi:MAG: hypothetical protein HC853_03055 [Anaerolineae bacterium]|nr:hypothetical protein [Anaerolineae bacterium]
MLKIKLILLPIEWHVTLRIKPIPREYYAATETAIRQGLDLPKIEHTNGCFSVQATMSPVTDPVCYFGQLAHSLWQATEAYAEIEVSVKDDLGEIVHQHTYRYADYWFYSAYPQPMPLNLTLQIRALVGSQTHLRRLLFETFPWQWATPRHEESLWVATGRGTLPFSLLRFAEEVAQKVWTACNGPAAITLSVSDANGNARTSLSYSGPDFQAWLTAKRATLSNIQIFGAEVKQS